MKRKRIGAAAGILTAALFLLGGLALLDDCFPVSPGDRPMSTVVLAADGTPLRAFADENGVWRYPISPRQVSPLYLQALITYEDRWFYYHPGVNPLAIIRALFQNLDHGRIVSGGSTLTMQTARILFPEKYPKKDLRAWLGKLRQTVRALQLEYRYTKAEILGLYLTYAPFGANIEGVWAASQTWLGKAPKELTHAEAALLAVLPQAPSRYRPDRHAPRARKARDKVLDRMAAFGKWDPGEIRAAKQEPVMAFRFRPPLAAPLAARRLFRENPGRAVIPTCLDFDLQTHVESVLADYLAPFQENQSGAVLVVNHNTLEVLAYAGSADFTSNTRQGHVDMVRASRSPGSTLKPFLYGMAMDAGLIHSHSLLLDIPRYTDTYMPGNFSGGFTGPVSVAKALRLSLNVPAIQVLEALGPQTFHDRLKNGGLRMRFRGKPNLSLALGGLGTDLESLVTLYTALGRQGLAGRPRLEPGSPMQERYLMSPGAAWIIRALLSQAMPGQEGVRRLAGRAPMAWKTGTSYGFRDAWALGLMGDYTAGVWIGRPDGSPSPGQYGAATALPLLARVMESLPRNRSPNPMPPTVSQAEICWPLGIARDRTDGPCPARHTAWILAGRIPPTLTQSYLDDAPLRRAFWVDRQGLRAAPACGGHQKKWVHLWPLGAEPWLPRAWRRDRLIPEPSPNCPDLAPVAATRVRIISISDNSILTRPPGQAVAPRIPLQAMGGQGRLSWFLNRAPIRDADVNGMALPAPGAYELAVIDETGRSDRIRFRVIQPTQ